MIFENNYNTGIAGNLPLKDQQVIALIGGGGKTSAMNILAKELVANNKKVVIGTTTLIGRNQGTTSDCSIISDDEEFLLTEIEKKLKPGTIILVGKEQNDSTNKIGSLSMEFWQKVANLADYLILEADGAKQRPFKAPAEHEPVIPNFTDLVLNMVGIDVINQPLEKPYTHRPELIAKIANCKIGDKVDAAMIATVLWSNQGGRKNLPSGCQWIPCINKADTMWEVAKARSVARKLVELGAKQVVIMATRSNEVVKEVLYASGSDSGSRNG